MCLAVDFTADHLHNKPFYNEFPLDTKGNSWIQIQQLIVSWIDYKWDKEDFPLVL
jgi:hypothetical protein